MRAILATSIPIDLNVLLDNAFDELAQSGDNSLDIGATVLNISKSRHSEVANQFNLSISMTPRLVGSTLNA